MLPVFWVLCAVLGVAFGTPVGFHDASVHVADDSHADESFLTVSGTNSGRAEAPIQVGLSEEGIVFMQDELLFPLLHEAVTVLKTLNLFDKFMTSSDRTQRFAQDLYVTEASISIYMREATLKSFVLDDKATTIDFNARTGTIDMQVLVKNVEVTGKVRVTTSLGLTDQRTLGAKISASGAKLNAKMKLDVSGNEGPQFVIESLTLDLNSVSAELTSGVWSAIRWAVNKIAGYFEDMGVEMIKDAFNSNVKSALNPVLKGLLTGVPSESTIGQMEGFDLFKPSKPWVVKYGVAGAPVVSDKGIVAYWAASVSPQGEAPSSECGRARIPTFSPEKYVTIAISDALACEALATAFKTDLLKFEEAIDIPLLESDEPHVKALVPLLSLFTSTYKLKVKAAFTKAPTLQIIGEDKQIKLGAEVSVVLALEEPQETIPIIDVTASLTGRVTPSLADGKIGSSVSNVNLGLEGIKIMYDDLKSVPIEKLRAPLDEIVSNLGKDMVQPQINQMAVPYTIPAFSGFALDQPELSVESHYIKVASNIKLASDDIRQSLSTQLRSALE